MQTAFFNKSDKIKRAESTFDSNSFLLNHLLWWLGQPFFWPKNCDFIIQNFWLYFVQ